MPTGLPSSAARKAALRAMLRMLPPATCSRRELGVVEPLGRRVGGEDAAPDRLALGGVGKGKLHDEAQAAHGRRCRAPPSGWW